MVCVCVNVVCVCVCVLDRDRSRMAASTAQAVLVVWTAMYLTADSGCLTGFHDPLSPP